MNCFKIKHHKRKANLSVWEITVNINKNVEMKLISKIFKNGHINSVITRHEISKSNFVFILWQHEIDVTQDGKLTCVLRIEKLTLQVGIEQEISGGPLMSTNRVSEHPMFLLSFTFFY